MKYRLLLFLLTGLLALGAAGIFLFRPAVPAAASAPEGLLLWIELDQKRLTVYENGAAIAFFPIASGSGATPSPIGVFRINQKFITEMSGFGTRFLGLNVPWGSYGLHGTNKPESIGQNASHGCIRLRVKDAETLYRIAGAGARVVIEGGPYGPLGWGLRTLREGDRGADVRQMQLRLIQRGFLQGGADGVFGAATRKAVMAARKAFSLPGGDAATPEVQRMLGMQPFD